VILLHKTIKLTTNFHGKTAMWVRFSLSAFSQPSKEIEKRWAES